MFIVIFAFTFREHYFRLGVNQIMDSGREGISLIPRPFWEGETAWQLPRVQTVTSTARELEDPIRFQVAVT